MRSIFSLVIAAGREFMQDRAMAYAAAIAYYTALSFAPLVLLLLTVGSFLGEGTSNELISFFQSQVGEQAGAVTETVIEEGGPRQEEQAWWRVVLSIGLLLFSASGVFAQLQASLNYIWEVEALPGQGVWGFVRKRLLSLGMVLTILFILLVALVVSSVLEQFVPGDSEVAARVTSAISSFLVATALFAAIYKVLPDAEIAWRDVWLGAGVTSLMFTLGKLGISLYLQHGSATKDYGAAAGSLIALLIWVYFAAVIFFFGAEITQEVAKRRGVGIRPSRHARRMPQCNTDDARPKPT
ncbi:MAG TPA: YihY/virulence factor BrkB family protein [Phycisphaerales bacterium]|nr:YihY/virulence factor BrkB family protein [Phycisphaerales bacterium]